MRIQESSQAILDKELAWLGHGAGAHNGDLGGKCLEGPPAAYSLNISPTQLVRLVELGEFERILDNNTIWVCAGCGTATTRRPAGIELPLVMEALRGVAFAETAVESEKGVKLAHRHLLENMAMYSRIRDPWFIVVFNGSLVRNGKESQATREQIAFIPKRIPGLERASLPVGSH